MRRHLIGIVLAFSLFRIGEQPSFGAAPDMSALDSGSGAGGIGDSMTVPDLLSDKFEDQVGEEAEDYDDSEAQCTPTGIREELPQTPGSSFDAWMLKDGYEDWPEGVDRPADHYELEVLDPGEVYISSDALGMSWKDLTVRGQGYWPKGLIPYEISAGAFTAKQEEMILKLIETWNLTNPSVLWIPKVGRHKDFVSFVSPGANQTDISRRLCTSPIGRMGGTQLVTLGETCFEKNHLILHEMMHAAGWLHEQQRWDRDKFVNYYEENIDPKYFPYIINPTATEPHKRNVAFGIDLGSEWRYPGKAYDTSSIMQYSSVSFALPAKRTLETKDGKYVGPSDTFTSSDKAVIKALYDDIPKIVGAPAAGVEGKAGAFWRASREEGRKYCADDWGLVLPTVSDVMAKKDIIERQLWYRPENDNEPKTEICLWTQDISQTFPDKQYTLVRFKKGNAAGQATVSKPGQADGKDPCTILCFPGLNVANDLTNISDLPGANSAVRIVSDIARPENGQPFTLSVTTTSPAGLYLTKLELSGLIDHREQTITLDLSSPKVETAIDYLRSGEYRSNYQAIATYCADQAPGPKTVCVKIRGDLTLSVIRDPNCKITIAPGNLEVATTVNSAGKPIYRFSNVPTVTESGPDFGRQAVVATVTLDLPIHQRVTKGRFVSNYFWHTPLLIWSSDTGPRWRYLNPTDIFESEWTDAEVRDNTVTFKIGLFLDSYLLSYLDLTDPLYPSINRNASPSSPRIPFEASFNTIMEDEGRAFEFRGSCNTSVQVKFPPANPGGEEESSEMTSW